MNIGVVTSTIIAGILLLSILSLNMNISNSSTGITMRQVVQAMLMRWPKYCKKICKILARI